MKNNMDDKFYQTALRLVLEDIEKGKIEMTISDAEWFYNFGIITIFKNGKITFLEEVNEK